ncbi:hypothetical protein IQ07DRAFT_593556 [Pyrenochaeta sp. DS3sAY3a]|nr:hypothetical protein IQ07DRAFT_593556 [Pyrenochaeta sp. DS3sAY3a]
MSTPTSKSNVQLGRSTLVRQCKVMSYKQFFIESPEGVEELAIDESSTDESEDDEDRLFIVQDETSGSEDDFVPQDDSSEDDDVSVSSDFHHDLTDGSDDGYDLSDMYAVLMSSINDEAAAKENRRHTAELEDQIEISPTRDSATSKGA